MENLYQKLLENGKSDVYPYHMPGHKRKPVTEVLKRVCDIDITEIDGFDNLHHAEGVLQDIQNRAARVYGADESHYLIGGSTAGILSAISAVSGRGDTILIGRNCHKSVYHAAYLNGLKLEYLFPDTVKRVGFPCGITAKQVKEALEKNAEIKAVIIVSPTYEGVVSDIYEIAKVVHGYGIPLVVDEAHGAHFGFHELWPKSACTLGADIVIQSLHKTLPSLTQTALLHINGSLVDRQKLRRFLAIYQTSSPSYVFMAGMEEAIEYMALDGKKEMDTFAGLWNCMLRKLEACEVLKMYPGDDIGKLVISIESSSITGQNLYDILLSRYHLQMEMAGGSYVLAMFTLCDEEDAYDRLADALLELDRELRFNERTSENSEEENIQKVRLEKALEFWEAWDASKENLEIEKCGGRVAGEFVNLYPPGTPVVVPGEVLNEEILEIIKEYVRQGLPVQGVTYQGEEVCLEVIHGWQ